LNVPNPAPAETLTLTGDYKKQLKKAQKKALDTVEKKRLIDEANGRERLDESLVPLVITRVDRDYSPGKKRQEGYGYVDKVAGVGGATLVSVQMDKNLGDGRLHHNVSVDHLTSAIVGSYGEIDNQPSSEETIYR
jgi:hypothetical protein